MDQHNVPLGTVITDTVTMLARALMVELRRMMLGLIASVITFVLLTTVAIVLVVVGVIRLGDALARVCSHWLGNAGGGDIVVGLAFLSIPLVSILLLRRRARR